MADESAQSAPEPVVASEEKTSEGKSKARKKWFPLESNPEVMTKYVAKMGFPTNTYRFVDVFSTEEWALGMVPQPALAVLFLFPIKDDSEDHKAEEAKRIAEKGQVVSDQVYFMKQTVGNACGTVGLLHAIGNAAVSKGVILEEGSFMQGFLNKTKGMSPADMAQALEDDQELEKTHTEAAHEGQSEQIPMEEQLNSHFVCLTEVDGCIYELDGRKDTPINHGPSSPATMLQDGCRVIQEFMARDPGEMRFTIVALVPTIDD